MYSEKEKKRLLERLKHLEITTRMLHEAIKQVVGDLDKPDNRKIKRTTVADDIKAEAIAVAAARRATKGYQ
jgi:hypothetical protein